MSDTIESLRAERDEARAEVARDYAERRSAGALAYFDGLAAALAAALAAERVANAGLRAMLRQDSPWSLREVLKRLADAVDHWLHAHNCDHQGHEGDLYAMQAAREILPLIDAALSAAPPLRCCSSSHEPPDTACRGFLAGANGRCVYCEHEEKCHPGPGATCEIGSGESAAAQPLPTGALRAASVEVFRHYPLPWQIRSDYEKIGPGLHGPETLTHFYGLPQVRDACNINIMSFKDSERGDRLFAEWVVRTANASGPATPLTKCCRRGTDEQGNCAGCGSPASVPPAAAPQEVNISTQQTKEEAHGAEAERGTDRALPKPREPQRAAQERAEGGDHHGRLSADGHDRSVRPQPDRNVLRSGNAVQRHAEGRALELATARVAIPGAVEQSATAPAAPQEQQGAAAMADITLCPRCGRPDPMFGNVKPTNATEQCWRRLLKAGNSIYVDTLCIAPASAASEPKAPPQEEKEKK